MRILLLVFAASVVMLPACTDGHLVLPGGYTTAPNYDCSIRTVYVPIAKNKTFRRGLEYTVTQAIVREIRGKTPFRVVDSPLGADSELLCTIVNEKKDINNYNQLGEVRDVQVSLKVEVYWKDLRPGHEGELLSGKGTPIDKQAKRGLNEPIPVAGDLPKQLPVIITPTTNYIPELGPSNASAEQVLANQLAVQIVSMMEVWR